MFRPILLSGSNIFSRTMAEVEDAQEVAFDSIVSRTRVHGESQPAEEGPIAPASSKKPAAKKMPLCLKQKACPKQKAGAPKGCGSLFSEYP